MFPLSGVQRHARPSPRTRAALLRRRPAVARGRDAGQGDGSRRSNRHARGVPSDPHTAEPMTRSCPQLPVFPYEVNHSLPVPVAAFRAESPSPAGFAASGRLNAGTHEQHHDVTVAAHNITWSYHYRSRTNKVTLRNLSFRNHPCVPTPSSMGCRHAVAYRRFPAASPGGPG